MIRSIEFSKYYYDLCELKNLEAIRENKILFIIFIIMKKNELFNMYYKDIFNKFQ